MEKKLQLPKEFAEKWVKALRSGEYEQGSEALHQNGKYCCLGLACLVSGHEYVGSEGLIDLRKYYKVPPVLTDVYEDEEGKMPNLDQTLATMNDSGSSFKDIANWIEHNIEFI